jgi:hypothetical protein
MSAGFMIDPSLVTGYAPEITYSVLDIVKVAGPFSRSNCHSMRLPL